METSLMPTIMAFRYKLYDLAQAPTFVESKMRTFFFVDPIFVHPRVQHPT